jgi:uncharacterized protein (TIGR03905 family)
METALTKEPFSTTCHSFETNVLEGTKAMQAQSVVYKPRGVCCTRISYEIRDGKLYNVRFEGGCHGNGQGLARLLEGMATADAQKRLSGITCESKPTSCPDQLARSL